MNTFAQAMSEEAVKTFTENGAVALETSGNANLDFFGRAGGMRGNPDIAAVYRKAMDEDLGLAVKNLFFLRDIRNGSGERDSFISCFRQLAERLTDAQFETAIEFIPEYGRWSDLFAVLRGLPQNRFESACAFVRGQVEKDYARMQEGKGVSLLGKWFPLANNRHNPEAIRWARRISAECFGSERNARKMIVPLRRHIGVLEQLLSANEWDKVEYSKIPSAAGMKYRQAFYKHDGGRYSEWLSRVERGEAKMNAGAVMPYDLVRKAAASDTGNDPALDLMWKNLPDWTNGSSSIVVADVSGSMYGFYGKNGGSAPAPIYVSTSLAMYFAEKCKGPFQNMTITFSESPECHLLDPNDRIRDRFLKLERLGGYNTDIQKVFEMYISLAKDAKPEDCPKNLVIISDMEFDAIEHFDFTANTLDELSKKMFKRKETLFKSIDKMFKEAGVERPTLVFWNCNSRNANVPVSKDEFGTVLVSGFSPTIFQYIVEGDINPMKFMLNVLANYDCILERMGILDKKEV